MIHGRWLPVHSPRYSAILICRADLTFRPVLTRSVTWGTLLPRRMSATVPLFQEARTMADIIRDVPFETPRDIRRVEDCHFYHTLDLPGIGVVEGMWDLRGRFDDYIGGVNLRDKTVLDVGTGNGFLTFEAEKRGAREVISFDIGDAKFQHLLPFKDCPYYTHHAEWRK